MKRLKFRKIGRWFLGAVTIVLIVCALIAQDVAREGGPIVTDAAAAPVMLVAIVFGAGIDNAVIDDRVRTGIALYKAGKVRKLLMTGDNGRKDYDEPDAMKAEAIAAGVPAADVTCDYAGFRTYDSLYRAHAIFGVNRALLVTQRYHLPRALFLAKHLGVGAVGVDAALHSYGGAQRWFDLRESAAVQTAWLDIHVLRRHPKYLGLREPIK